MKYHDGESPWWYAKGKQNIYIQKKGVYLTDDFHRFYVDLFYEDISFKFSPFIKGDPEKIDELAMKDHTLILEKIASAFEVC